MPRYRVALSKMVDLVAVVDVEAVDQDDAKGTVLDYAVTDGAWIDWTDSNPNDDNIQVLWADEIIPEGVS